MISPKALRFMEKKSVERWMTLLKSIDSKDKKAKIAARLVKLAALPKRKRVEVNLDKLSSHAVKGENIIVPGKILGTGAIDKAIGLSAIEYSGSASKKLKDAGCTVMPLEEMLKKDQVKIII